MELILAQTVGLVSGMERTAAMNKELSRLKLVEAEAKAAKQ